MTAQPPEQTPPQQTLSAYEVALAALVAAALVETARIWDHLVPGLVEEVPARSRRLLGLLLARSWAVFAHRARTLAALTGSTVTGLPPVTLPEPEVPRLIEAAEALLDRAERMGIEREDAEAEAPLTFDDFAEEMAELARQRMREALHEFNEAKRLRREATALDRTREQEARAEAEEIAALEAEDAAQQAEERRRRAEQDRADEEAIEEARRADVARWQEAEAEERRQHARVERRRAQLARAQNVARSETTAAAAETLPQALSQSSRFVGWVRKVNDGACDRCVGWWKSGGDPRGASPVRPWSVPMKRHHGCTCTQHPVTEEEARVRGTTDEPEPRLRNRPAKRTADRATAHV